MSTPEQIEQDIERIRADVREDVEVLHEKVNPATVVGAAPDKLARRARGNPIVVGLGAFLVGWLVASQLPG